MRRVSRRGWAISLALSIVAGYVDGIGFIETGGFFVSFMSGNSTQAGVELSAGEGVRALFPLFLVAAFVLGVALAAAVVGERPRRRAAAVGGAALAVGLCAVWGASAPGVLWRFDPLALAMGALNTLYLAEGRARVAVTYATGTLVSLGLALAALVTGRSRTAWRRPFFLWGSLAGGAVIGAFVHRFWGGGALVVAASALAVLAVVVATVGGTEQNA